MSDDITSTPANVGPGDKIAGYRLEEQIGQGGMAVVYRAHDERLDRRVALKLLAPGLASDAAFRARFIRESRAAAAVDHPNVIPVYDAGDAGGFLFIAMRYVQGGDVRSLLGEGTALPAPRVWNIITQVAAALDAAHAHDLIHRDVKPANILLDAGGGTTGGRRSGTAGDQHDHVYLSDFGISKQTLASHLTSTGQFVGTLDYIAPEQIEGRPTDGRADQYSLACAAFELLCGDPPFRRDLGLALINAHLSEQPPSLIAKRPELPAAVDRVLAKAMAKSPDQRYATCSDFSADLGRALQLVPGPLLVGGLPPVGSGADSGDQPKPWPATELAASASGPGSVGPAGVTKLPPGGQTPPGAQTPPPGAPIPPPGAQTPPPGAQAPPPGAPWPAGAPGAFDAATMNAGQPWPQGQGPTGQQAPPAGTWPQGGQQGPQGNYGQYAQYPPQGGTGGPGAQGWQQYPPQGGTGAPGWQQYPPPGGPTDPRWQQPPGPAKRSRGLMVGVVVAALLVAGAGVGVAVELSHKNVPTPGPTTGPSSSSAAPATSSAAPPAPTAESEATTVNTLLVNSANTRLQWNANTLVSDVSQCIDINYDVNQIRQIANQRSTELSQADGLQTGAIQNGAAVKSELVKALQISLNIDNEYLQWAEQQRNSGCTVGTDSTYYDEATSSDSQATAEKTTFVDTWNPIAGQYGLQPFSADQI